MSATPSNKLAFHILTSNEIVARPDFIDTSRSIIEALNPNCYFHLRVNTLSGSEHLLLATRLKAETDKVGAHLIVNGRVDVALASDACGIQLGRGSLPLTDVLKVWGSLLKIGVSVHSEKEVRDLYKILYSSLNNDHLRVTYFEKTDSGLERGAEDDVTFPSWLLAGHVFETRSHPGVPPIGLEGLSRIVNAAAPGISSQPGLESIPVIAVGGINPTNLTSVVETGVAGVAVISDVWASNDPKGAATRYLSLL